ncbi:peptidase S8 [Segetibacter sp. 3557_3]|uniref:S8 family peptidase n=1 Tax=Segetibacter sp. 3557_3 TaxID=2547429 RepID=UPI001058D875|nr:S8 family serine peptidase [Segetibacter sp. 3557_3]TDH18474.1 peptidase S8 [Segetibacter sp. 3557_3]
MEFTELINVKQVMDISSGSPEIIIGLIDGPVSTNHLELNRESIKEIPGVISGTCSITESVACEHGTFIAGILVAKRGSRAPAICPNCTLLIRSVFSELPTNNYKSVLATTPQELALAIYDCINAGARLINLSLALINSSSKGEPVLEEALNYAANLGVVIVAAAGNQGTVGSTAITRHPWVIPVIACNNNGNPMQLSNLGNSIGKRGLSAPGENITSLGLDNNTLTISGTSAAAPFVTGVIALLWSEFPKLSGSLIKHAVNTISSRKSITPPLINAMAAFQYLNLQYRQKAIA